MAKYYGQIGYIKMVESTTEPGYWYEEIEEHKAYGDVTRNTSRYQQSNGVNDDITLNNIISIVADPYASSNFQHMRYATYMGTKWKITNVEIEYPRILLTIGGVYNAYKTETR